MRILMLTWIPTVLLFSNFFRINVLYALGQCLLNQKTLLLQIRSNLTYDPLASTKLVQWDEKINCCKWPGVSCNNEGYISVLDLSNEPIYNGVNDHRLLKLRSLSVIRLDGVNFSSPFPEFFVDFANLTELSLAGCNFIGKIPGKVFQVRSLEAIDLTNNEMLGGSLPEFPGNGFLQSLKLGNTKFSGNLPESIGNLRMLSYVNLVGCNFSGSIDSIGKLTKLVELRLAKNHFSGSIPSFKLSKNLTFLDLSDNQFTGEIPFFHLYGLDNLDNLYLNNNSFSGPIPVSLFFLPSLLYLDVSRNKFSGQIVELQNVSIPLVNLDLSSNNLEGPIPLFLFRLQNLSSLSLSSNKFNGTVHLTKFRNPENVDSLDLSDNRLAIETNISDEELAILPQFGSLWLASCDLQNVPNFLRNQSRLMMLDLSSNTISGEIPDWIWGINNGYLKYLNLSHNRFTRMREPKRYGFHDYLDLHSNLLSGNIPRPPRAAVHLDLSSNNFSSVIPPDIGDQLPNVRFFSIANNRVGGSIPPSWCHAAYLEVLDLSNNALQGTIPSCLVQNNTNLGVLKLGGNHLSGEMPQVFLKSCSLETLDLSFNLMEGRIPPSLVNCTKLKVLNLGNNRISDTFPCWLNKLSNLHILALRSNHFHGSISCSILGFNNSWPSLQVIDLASNNFSGILPADLFSELKAIVAQPNFDYLHFTSPTWKVYYQDSVFLSLKGQGYSVEKILTVFTSIDFSGNRFQGGIPDTIGGLKMLYLLNISRNALTGSIPRSLENLIALEALDVSFNNLTGNIPEEIERLSFLSLLNLSYNHLVGRIPQGNQFKTFDASSFMGNEELCGFPLNVSCHGVKEPAASQEEKESSYYINAEFYISIALGFAVGLGGIFLPLFLSNRWRSYCNEKIDQMLAKIFFQGDHGRKRRI